MIAKRSRMLPSYDPKTDAALAYGRETSVQLLRRIVGEDGGSKRAMALSTRQLGRMAPLSGIEAWWFFYFLVRTMQGLGGFCGRVRKCAAWTCQGCVMRKAVCRA